MALRAFNIVNIYSISEITEAQCYWGKEKLQHLVTCFSLSCRTYVSVRPHVASPQVCNAPAMLCLSCDFCTKYSPVPVCFLLRLLLIASPVRLFSVLLMTCVLSFCTVQVTLVQNNNPDIVISDDRRQIQYEDHKRRKFAEGCENFHEGVLGHPAIESGKHYWEVDVSRNCAWVLGLSDGSYLFNPIFSSNAARSTFFRLEFSKNSHYQPKYGFWVIGLWKRSVCAFEECALTGKGNVLTLSLMVPPRRVGVFLDYAAGTLSFYNISNHGTLIYRFCARSFPDKVFPYFNPRGSSEPMTICWPDS